MLASALAKLSRQAEGAKGEMSEADVAMEYEILKCFRTLLNSNVRALTHWID